MGKRKSTSSPDSRRRQKRRADRISDLPDSVIGNILSFLPTENAVATSVLSRRWRFLWTTVANLDFTFPRGGDVEEFVQFVNYVLLLHKPAGGFFNKFTLTWDTEYIPFHVNTWIRTAVARDVHELDFDVGICTIPNHVQSSLFSHEKLKSLELKCSILISTQVVVSLPRLESLWMTSVSFQSEEAFGNLLDGCPALKKLVVFINVWNMVARGYIEQVKGRVAFKFMVSSTCLKHLELYPFGNKLSALCSVELDAPSLEYIKLLGMNCFAVKQRLNFLREADIHLITYEQESIVPNYNNSIVEAIQALSRAKGLHLSGEVMQALSCATIKMQTGFSRLKNLVVHLYKCKNYWSSIQKFMELSDNLEEVLLDKNEEHYVDKGLSNWTKPSVVPRCLSNSLKLFAFVAYNGDPDELAMVEYITKHGSVLDTMHINFGKTFSSVSHKKNELAQLICTFPSKACVFEKVQFADSDTHVIPVMHTDPSQLSVMMKKSRSVTLLDVEDFDEEDFNLEWCLRI